MERKCVVCGDYTERLVFWAPGGDGYRSTEHEVTEDEARQLLGVARLTWRPWDSGEAAYPGPQRDEYDGPVVYAEHPGCQR